LSKLIYRFNNQKTQSGFNSKIILGGKGANLAQMAKLGLPVPPGFTITTKVCEDFYKNNKKIPKKLFQQVKKEIKIIEKISKKIIESLLSKNLIIWESSHDKLESIISGIIVDDLMVEDHLNEEVKELLDSRTDEYERSMMDYGRVFQLVKSKLARERGLIF